MRQTILILAAGLISVAVAVAGDQGAPAGSGGLESLAFLVGEWEGGGSGTPGESSGSFSFAPDLQGHVLVRRNEAHTPSGLHQDLMVIYRAGDAIRAFYVDNEGHSIGYVVTATTSPATAVFLSEGSQGAPRFRLTYTAAPDGSLTGAFDIAPPGGDFKPYLSWTARRK